MPHCLPLAFDEFDTFDKSAAACCHPAERQHDFVKLHRIGQTYPGRDIWLPVALEERLGTPPKTSGYGTTLKPAY